MDVNDFKYINDSFGHSMGDKAISTMGNILLNQYLMRELQSGMRG